MALKVYPEYANYVPGDGIKPGEARPDGVPDFANYWHDPDPLQEGAKPDLPEVKPKRKMPLIRDGSEGSPEPEDVDEESEFEDEDDESTVAVEEPEDQPPDPPDKSPAFKCQLCNKPFEKQSSLRGHRLHCGASR